MKLIELFQFIAYGFSFDENRVMHEESDIPRKGFYVACVCLSLLAVMALILGVEQ